MNNKVRVLIITLHAVNNYGSFLQAMATQKLLEDSGFEVLFYNYIPYESTFLGLIKLWGKASIVRTLTIMPTIARWKVVFEKRRRKELHLTNKKYYRIEDFEEKKESLPHAYCVGSDQVWNTVWNRGVVPELYLSFTREDEYRFSFASSFGRECIENEETLETCEWLGRFNRLSVREESAKRILEKQYNINRCETLMDPTLMITKEEWARYMSPGTESKPFILVYSLYKNKEFDNYVKRVSRKTGLPAKRICFRYDQIIRTGEKVLIPNVPRFLSLFAQADYVITDSFHGVAFSVVFNTPLLCFPPQRFSDRIIDFLSRINAVDRIVKDANDFSALDREMDYAKINTYLEDERLHCKSFLAKVYKDIQERICHD